MAINELAIRTSCPPKRYGKRLFDILFSSLVLLFASPLYLFLYILVKSSSPGPALYKGLRMGRNGRIIYCWKFRTMVVHADQKLQALLKNNPQFKQEWETFHKLKKDPRLTKIGSFLRRTSLDEIPQFWNVLKGDLSVVGPRPIEIRERQNAYEEIRCRYRQRTEKILSIRPGLVSLWQLQGRNDLTMQQRAHLEEQYVNSQSLKLDIKIICKTLLILLFPKGAY